MQSEAAKGTRCSSSGTAYEGDFEPQTFMGVTKAECIKEITENGGKVPENFTLPSNPRIKLDDGN